MKERRLRFTNESVLDMVIPCETCETKPLQLNRTCLECVAQRHREYQRDADVKWSKGE